MKIRIPVIPAGLVAIGGVGAAVWWASQPAPAPPPRPSLLDHLDEGEQELVQGALVGLLMIPLPSSLYESFFEL